MSSSPSKRTLVDAVINLGRNGFFFEHRLDTVDFDLSKNLSRKPFIVRNATHEDIDQLADLEATCWHHLQVPRNELIKRIQRFPSGQYVAIMDNKVIGVLYTQKISSRNCLLSSSFSLQGENHLDDGSVLQLLGVAALPSYSNLQVANTMRFLALNLAICNDMDEVVAATRCGTNYSTSEIHDAAAMAMNDPILRFHAVAGANFVQLLHGYRPDDTGNFGRAVLVSYSIRSFRDESSSAEISKTVNTLRNRSVVSFQTIVNCLNRVTQGNFIPSEQLLTTPFMQLGLDSLKMMEMRNVLSSLDDLADMSIPNTVLFDYPTPLKLLEYLNGQENIIFGKNSNMKDQKTDINVFGVSCRFPNGANNPQQFFEMLCNKESFFRPLPDAWKTCCNSKVAGFLDDNVSSTFDPDFFGISHEEVSWMDPHQRILLEVAHEALYDAGILDKLSNFKVGVFVGFCNNEWIRKFHGSDVKSPYVGSGTAQSAAANRISFLFGLTGPSVVIDTACSSSLSAVHTAMLSLQNGDCDIALVAGADLLLSPFSLQVRCEVDFLSSFHFNLI